MSYDLTTEHGVVAKMKQSNSEQEWNRNADKVKDANNGYPSFWFFVIVVSGVMADTVAKWKN